MAANRKMTPGARSKSPSGRAGRREPITEDQVNKLTTGQDQAVAQKWIAWNHDQTLVVARARTRAEAKEAARQAGVPDPVVEKVEQTRKLLADQYAGGEELYQRLLAVEGQLLSASAVARLVGISPDEVEERRAAGRLIAIPQERAFGFPSWQFSGDGTLAGLEDVLADLHRH